MQALLLIFLDRQTAGRYFENPRSKIKMVIPVAAKDCKYTTAMDTHRRPTFCQVLAALWSCMNKVGKVVGNHGP